MRKLLIFLFATTSLVVQAQQAYHRTVKLMGSRFDITVLAEQPSEGEHYIELAINEISRIEKLISSWDPASQTSKINKNAGIIPVKVDPELFDLITRAITISELTGGAFDVSYASMDGLWSFDGTMSQLPPIELIESSVAHVGYERIRLDPDNRTVFLQEPGMKIGFGAIGKGYAADKAKQLLVSQGVVAGIINASGDMSTWGKQADGTDWNIAITNPLNKNQAFATLPITEGAVVTSGDYEKYAMIDGVRYAHIIDPRTGYPAKGILSVTVFASRAELADALATAVFVMGQVVGLDRINQLPGVECIIVDDQGKIHTSNNIKLNKI